MITVPDTGLVTKTIETAPPVNGAILREYTGTNIAVSSTTLVGTSTSSNSFLSAASMPSPTTDDQPDLVIIIEGDSDPIIKTEALQPVEDISISPKTLEQIDLAVIEDKFSGCGTVEVANGSGSSAQEPNWGTSSRTEGDSIGEWGSCSLKGSESKGAEGNFTWGSPKGDSGFDGQGGCGRPSPKGFESKGVEGSSFDKPSSSLKRYPEINYGRFPTRPRKFFGNTGGSLSKKSRRSEDMTDYSTSERHMRLSMLYGLNTTHTCPLSSWNRTVLRSDPIGTRGSSIILNLLTTKLVINSLLNNLSVLFLEPKFENFFNRPYHLRLRGTFTSSLPPLNRTRSRFSHFYSG